VTDAADDRSLIMSASLSRASRGRTSATDAIVVEQSPQFAFGFVASALGAVYALAEFELLFHGTAARFDCDQRIVKPIEAPAFVLFRHETFRVPELRALEDARQPLPTASLDDPDVAGHPSSSPHQCSTMNRAS
jgi:hypothetical protein